MPITIQHVLTATTPDNTSAEIRPSHWNSAHAVSVSLAGSEVIKVIAAGGNTQSSGTISFSNANGVSFGLNGGTITASHNALTTQSVQTQGVQGIAGGGNTVTGGTVVFSNGNGLAFGVNGSTITGSYTVPTQSAQSIGIYASSQTTGASSSSTVDARSLTFVGAGGVSVGLTGGSVVVSGATGGGGAGDGFNRIAAGTQTAGTLTTINFADSNGITFGMSGSAQITASHNGLTSQSGQAVSAANGSSAFQTLSFGNSNGVSWSVSNGSVVASVAAAGTATVYAGSNTTNASSSVLELSSLQVAGAGNISVGFSNGSLIVSGASGAAQTITQYATGNTAGDASTGAQALSSIVVRGAGVASVGYSNDGALIISVPAGGGGGDGANFLAAGTQTATTLGTVRFEDSNGISFGMSGSTRITASYSQSAQTVGIYMAGNTTGESSSSTRDARSITIHGHGINSVGWSNNILRISATQDAQAVSAANGSYSFQTLSFSNANGVSWSTSAGSAIVASHNGLTTAAASDHSHGNPTLALTNLSGTTASASNGLTLSLSANAPGAATLTVSAVGNTTVNSSGTWPNALSIRGYGVLSVGTSNGSLLLSTPDAVDFTQLSVGVSTGGNTAGDTGLFTGRLVLAGGANITLSGSSNGGSATMSIVGAAGGGGGVAISGGTQLATSGTVVFSNSNNLSFGLSGSTRMTMSGALNLYGLGNTTQNSSTVLGLAAISLNGLGGMTVGYSNGSVQLSAPAVSSLSATGAVSISTNGSTVSIGVPQLSIYASSNTTGQSSSSSVAIGSLSVRGAGGVSVGMSAGELVISGATGGAGAAVTASAANGSYTVGVLSFSNANGVSFATSAGSAIVASVNTSYAASDHSHGNPTLALTNISGTTASASNGLTLSLSVAAQTNQTVGLYALGNTTQNSSTTLDARSISYNGLGAMTVGFSNGSVQLSAPATSSLSATGQVSISTNGSTISIGVPAEITVGIYEPYEPSGGQFTAQGQNSLFLQPVRVDNYVSFNSIGMWVSCNATTAASASIANSYTFSYGLYTRGEGASSTSYASLGTSSMAVLGSFNSNVSMGFTVSQGTNSTTYSSGGSNLASSFQGAKSFNLPFQSTLSPGGIYIFVMASSTTQTNNTHALGLSLMEMTYLTGLTNQQFGVLAPNGASVSNKSIVPVRMLRNLSVTSGAWPASIAGSDLSGYRNARYYLVFRT